MTVTITTSGKYREIIREILISLDLLDPFQEDKLVGTREYTILYVDDTRYRDITSWASDALACGLIFGFQVER